ncbi:aminodeoxychorismate lyase [Desulfosarcina ovata subsp. sediminis]|uniref:Endolytic murein transglycosylase n=1 Tax=Desulfosarcina ovata subsp. sediminis TaxID=885957 RepID=A0A5K7ZJS3_9BACT|nr:endolytic transglycosylase MltG [Desulfosarcina ovata]BBO80485.1 aminodeoxychorismate lyase [Desulfosarcina ovata subsp. sediminis]
MIKKLILLWVALLLIGAGSAGLLYWHLISWAERPMAEPGQEKLFTLLPGQGLKQTARALHREGLISDALRFTILARMDKQDKLLKAGEYFLSTSMTPQEILGQMVEGRVRLYRLTIPEGYNLVQIAKAVAAAGLADEKSFLDAARNPEMARLMDIPADTLEGYLFPDTYYFPRGLDTGAIVITMVKQFRAAFKPEWVARAKALGMTVHEVVTLASIVEKETGAPQERPLVASVFHNRLKKGMRLETDPTVIYGIADFDGNIKRKHLETYTPYNTYKIQGLPPGPIASPGALAIEAVLYPAESNYLYFVSKRDGTHHFSTSYKEHDAAVRKYQLGNRSR